MRLIRTSVTAIAVGFAVLGAGAVDAQAPANTVLPAQITIETGHVIGSISYRIGRDGRPHRVHRLASPWAFPADSACCAAPGVWWAIRHGHLLVGRGTKDFWRSRGLFDAMFGIGAIEVGSRTLAFSYGNSLYLAPLRGSERLIGRAEYPLGFTTGGLYTISWVHGLLLRSDTGAILKTLVHWTLGPVVVRGRLYFVDHRVLMMGRGARVQRLMSLASLGMSHDVWLQPLSGLVELMDNNRLTLLRPDGSVFASTPLPGSHGVTDTLSSSPVGAPNGRAVAFTAIAGESGNPNAAVEVRGTETVYLLRAGSHAAAAVFTERVAFQPCEQGANVAWRGSWLLYTNAEHNLAAIDTDPGHHAVDFTTLIRRLPGAHDGFTAYWSGQPPAF